MTGIYANLFCIFGAKIFFLVSKYVKIPEKCHYYDAQPNRGTIKDSINASHENYRRKKKTATDGEISAEYPCCNLSFCRECHFFNAKEK